MAAFRIGVETKNAHSHYFLPVRLMSAYPPTRRTTMVTSECLEKETVVVSIIHSLAGYSKIPTQVRKILIINAMASLQVEQSVRSAHARATFSIENERA
jgi:hypothetical protein